MALSSAAIHLNLTREQNFSTSLLNATAAAWASGNLVAIAARTSLLPSWPFEQRSLRG